MRKPMYLKDLEACGISAFELYERTSELRRLFGITGGYSTIKRKWFFQKIGGVQKGECIVAIVWVHVTAFVERLNNPQALAGEFYDKLPIAALQIRD